MNLDIVDRRILRELQRDGTLSQTALAERVGASAASCWRRVRALEAAGVLGQTVRLVNAGAVGMDINVICQVRLKNHLPATTASFEALLDERPEILECFAVSGEWDYMLRVVAVSIAAYEDFLRSALLAADAVGAAASIFVLSTRKATTALPV